MHPKTGIGALFGLSLPPAVALGAAMVISGCGASPGKMAGQPEPGTGHKPVLVMATDPEPAPSEPRPCPLTWHARSVRAPVPLPQATMWKAVALMLEAVCACTAPGDHVDVVADIAFTEGRVRLSAPRSSAVNACLQNQSITFGPAHRWSDEPTDCIGCGPRQLQALRELVDHRGHWADVRVRWPVMIERGGELLECPAGSHASEGECVEDPPRPPATPPAANCGCAPGDLMCNINCQAASRPRPRPTD